VMEILADQIAVAIDNARLYGEVRQELAERERAERVLEKRAAQLALLSDIGSKIAAVSELDTVLERAARLVQAGFGYHHVALFTHDPKDKDMLVMRTKAGAYADLFPADHRLKLGQGMVGWVGRQGKRLLANDVSAESHYVNLYPDAIPTQSELSVPIRLGQEIVGVLDVQSPEIDAFDENDVMVIEILADQIASAIDSEAHYRMVSELASDFAFAVHVAPDTAQVPSWVMDAFKRIDAYACGDSAVVLRRDWEAKLAPKDLSLALTHLDPDNGAGRAVALRELLERAVGVLTEPLQRAGLELTLDIPDNLPPIQAAPNQIVQVLLNLLINAIEAMPDGGQIHVTAKAKRGKVVLRLTNDGPPVPEEHLGYVFAPFFTTKPAGTGLGLFISQKIVEDHGGTIAMENLADTGGVGITITLPAARR